MALLIILGLLACALFPPTPAEVHRWERQHNSPFMQ